MLRPIKESVEIIVANRLIRLLLVNGLHILLTSNLLMYLRHILNLCLHFNFESLFGNLLLHFAGLYKGKVGFVYYTGRG